MKGTVFGKKKYLLFVIILAITLCGSLTNKNIMEIYPKSLHNTGEGMRYWYEGEGGFMSISGIPYNDLDCKNCHVTSCGQCHEEQVPEKISKDALTRALDQNTCLGCHTREKATINLGKKTDAVDVHFAMGMTCIDCHPVEDIHGDGTRYNSMRDTGAVKAACGDCHTIDNGTLQASRSHTIHKGKLECSSCHVKKSTTCLNCHFQKFMETGKRKGNFIPPVMKWAMLINYKGKVTLGNVQTLVYKGKKFAAYVPYHTHAVQTNGRLCEECHNIETVKEIRAGKKIRMMDFVKGKIVHFEGVVPVVDNAMEWICLDKKGDTWVPLKTSCEMVIQYAGHGRPITRKQLRSMSREYTYDLKK